MGEEGEGDILTGRCGRTLDCPGEQRIRAVGGCLLLGRWRGSGMRFGDISDESFT